MRSDVKEICNVYIIARDGGKIVQESVGHNVWTNTGREYSCMMKTLGTDGQPMRNDRIAYIGLGTGSQVEAVSVSKLVTPVAFSSNGDWLKEIDHRKTQFVQGDLKTSVRYSALFKSEDINTSNDQLVNIRECGLFTNGSANAPFTPGARNVKITGASIQSPVAYHAFDPIPKTPSLEIEVIWELRH
jgi:hypothetical protein